MTLRPQSPFRRRLPPPSPADRDVAFPVAVMVLFAFSFALPVIVVIGSFPGGLLSAAIIGFGMHQAWRMTAAPRFTITGRTATRGQRPAVDDVTKRARPAARAASPADLLAAVGRSVPRTFLRARSA